MIGEILSALNIVEKLGRFVVWLRKYWNRSKSQESEIGGTLASRFIKLFESHNVHRNQIPRFFGHGLTVKDVQDEISLLEKLDETVLEDVCALFAVRSEWLEGADSVVYNCHDFYKHPESVETFLCDIKRKSLNGDLDGILIAPINGDGDALIVLSEVIGEIGEKIIYRYHLLNNWRFDYWKSRAYLAACVAIAWKNDIKLRGRFLSAKKLNQISFGEKLVGIEDGSILGIGIHWYPEDMALDPQAYLSGVDPERNKYGVISAVKLWLELEEKGYMNTGLSMYSKTEIRKSFEEVLKD